MFVDGALGCLVSTMYLSFHFKAYNKIAETITLHFNHFLSEAMASHSHFVPTLTLYLGSIYYYQLLMRAHAQIVISQLHESLINRLSSNVRCVWITTAAEEPES